MSRILLIYHLLFLSSFLETKVVDVRGKPLSRGTVITITANVGNSRWRARH